MKKLLLSIAAILFSASSFSQINAGEFSVDESSVYYGVRLGLNLANLSGDGHTLGTKTGLNLGGVIGLRLSDTTPVFLESGLYFTQRGAEEGKTEINLNYLEIPILIKAGFNVTDDIAVLPFIGPTLSLGISGKMKGYDENGVFDSESSFDSDKYSRPDVGIKIGCGAEWNMIYLEAGYQFGITNVLDSEEYSQHGNALFMNLGVNF